MEFTNVKLIGNANVYFDGRVSSRTFYKSDGQRRTLGFVMAGDYEFATDEAEYMEILQGILEVKLPDETEYVCYKAGDTFTIPSQIHFHVRTNSYADYCCTYLSEK